MTDWDAYCKTKCNDTNSYCNTNTPRVCHGCNDPCGGSQVTYYHCSNGVCQKSQPYLNDPTCQNQCVKPPPPPPPSIDYYYCDTNNKCVISGPTDPETYPNDPTCQNQCVKPPPPPPPSIDYYYCDTNNKCVISGPTDPETYPNDPTCQNQCVKPPPPPPPSIDYYYCDTNNKCVISGPNDYKTYTSLDQCQRCCENSVDKYYHCELDKCLENTNKNQPRMWKNDPTCGSNSCANETKLCNDACPQRGGSWCKSFNPGVSYCYCKDPTKQKIVCLEPRYFYCDGLECKESGKGDPHDYVNDASCGAGNGGGCKSMCSGKSCDIGQYCDGATGKCATPKTNIPFVLWVEHAGGTSADAVRRYYKSLVNFVRGNAAGIRAWKLLVRVENPLNDMTGERTVWYPDNNCLFVTELLMKLPTNVQVYILPYLHPENYWYMYNPTKTVSCTSKNTIQDYAQCSKSINSGDSCCAWKPCGTCLSNEKCIMGACTTIHTQTDCGPSGCNHGMECIQTRGAKAPKCAKVPASGCGGIDGVPCKCCQGYTGIPCNQDSECPDMAEKVVSLALAYNALVPNGYVKVSGIVFDAEGSGVATLDFLKALKYQTEIQSKNSTTFNFGTTVAGESLTKAIQWASQGFEVYMELYNITTKCNTNSNSGEPWPVGKQLVDSFETNNGTCQLGGCSPDPSCGNSIYLINKSMPDPASSILLKSNTSSDYYNFETILKYNWHEKVPQEAAKNIYFMFSTETQVDASCMFPTGDTCGLPNAFGSWAHEDFTRFASKFSENLNLILPTGSAIIPAKNIGIYTFPLLPKAWVGSFPP